MQVRLIDLRLCFSVLYNLNAIFALSVITFYFILIWLYIFNFLFSQFTADLFALGCTWSLDGLSVFFLFTCQFLNLFTFFFISLYFNIRLYHIKNSRGLFTNFE